MATRNCETRPVTWKIHRNRALAEAVKQLGALYEDPKKGFIIWPMWIGFITHRDNLGYFEGSPATLRDSFYPHHPEITIEETRQARDILADKGLIILYEVDGLEYVLIPKVSHWNRLVGNISVKTDFPVPPAEAIRGWEDQFHEVYTPPSRTVERGGVSYADKVNAFFKALDPAWVAELKAAYPKIDVAGELAHMRVWLLSNPDNSKKNFKKFAVNWLNRCVPPQAGKAKSLSSATCEAFIEEKLGRIATKDMIKDVLRALPPTQGWCVGRFLRNRYPGSDGRGFAAAEREVLKERMEGN